MSSEIITRVFTGVDLRNGLDGLHFLEKKFKLKSNEIALFLNAGFDAAKIMTSRDELTYKRPQRLLRINEILKMMADAQGQPVSTVRKKQGPALKKLLFSKYENLEERLANAEKREKAREQLQKSKGTSSK